MSSCTLGDTPNNCVPDQQIGCVGSNGCQGHQRCSPDGYHYLACECDKGGTVLPFTIDASTDAALPNLLGAPCLSKADCGPLLDCLDSLSKKIFGEGPANGICVADCSKGASVCTDLDPTSVCRTFDDNGTPTTTSDDIAYCTRGCTAGTASGPDKCFGRPDMACLALGTATSNGTCIPVCRNDADCAPRYCDLASGLCADGPRKGSPIGAVCSATSAGGCQGYCSVGVSTTFAECTGYCSNGNVGCGESGGPPYDVFCVTPVSSTGAWSGGDFGYCEKLCDCDGDCGRTDAVCSPLPAAQVTALGKKGACRSATLPGGDPRPGLACAK